MSGIETRARHRCFGGSLSFHVHRSAETGTDMRFGVFTPPQAEKAPVPVLYYLAGLECTEETFLIKTGAIRLAAELGLMLVAPDTSPRGAGQPILPSRPFGDLSAVLGEGSDTDAH